MTDELHEDETGETAESKIEITRRLQASGLWDQVSVYRTERRIRYRDVGLTKKEAKEKSWADMQSKYPPPGVEPVEPPDIEMPEPVLPEPEDDIVHIAATLGSMDVARDVEWAYNNLNDQRVRADQAPSGGAWSMLLYAREARHKFLELVAKYDVQKQKQDEKESIAFLADAADHTKAIEKLLAITERVHREEIEDAIRQCPDEVLRVLRKAGWECSRPAEPAGIGTMIKFSGMC